MRMAHGLWHGAGAVGAGALAGIVVLVCLGGNAGGDSHSAHGAGARHHPVATAAVVAQGTASNSISYNLYTHCGIDEALIRDRYYVAVHPLSDGAGNPPAGWGNPYQAGTMTTVSATEAVFTDRAGHHVVFKVRPGARAFLHHCS